MKKRSYMPLTEKRKQRFLNELAKHGIVSQAAKAASPKASLGCYRTFVCERARNPEFAEAWEDALMEAHDNIEAEIVRRGQEGWEEPQFNKQTGEKYASLRKYSDRLLELRAKAHLRNHGETVQKIQLSGKVETDGPDILKALSSLSPEKREAIAKILQEETEETGS